MSRSVGVMKLASSRYLKNCNYTRVLQIRQPPEHPPAKCQKLWLEKGRSQRNLFGIKVIYEGHVEGVFSRKVGNLEYMSNPLVLDRALGSWQKWWGGCMRGGGVLSRLNAAVSGSRSSWEAINEDIYGVTAVPSRDSRES